MGMGLLRVRARGGPFVISCVASGQTQTISSCKERENRVLVARCPSTPRTTQAGGQRGRDFSQRAFCLFYEQLWDNRQRFNAIKQQLQKLITMREHREVARIRD